MKYWYWILLLILFLSFIITNRNVIRLQAPFQISDIRDKHSFEHLDPSLSLYIPSPKCFNWIETCLQDFPNERPSKKDQIWYGGFSNLASLCYKDHLAENFDPKFLPHTWLLHQKQNHESFLEYSVQHPESRFYLKKNVQARQGIEKWKPMMDLNKKSQDGYVIVQEHIPNGIQIGGYPVNLRMYFISFYQNNHWTFYMPHQGYFVYSDQPNETITGLKRHPHTFYNKDRPFFWQDYASSSMYRGVMFELFQKCCQTFVKHVRPIEEEIAVIEIFGLDLLPTTDGHIYLLEWNHSPDLYYTGIPEKVEKKWKGEVIQDMCHMIQRRRKQYLTKGWLVELSGDGTIM